MEISILCPHTQTVLAVWILADYGSLIDDDFDRAAALETVANVAAWEYIRKGRADQGWRAPDVRNS